MLDQQPTPALPRCARPASAGANQHPRAFQLHALQTELQLALLKRLIDIIDFGQPGSLVPHHDDSGAISLRNNALEVCIIQGMVLNPHRQAFVGWIEGWTLGNGPGEQNAAMLETEVIMQVAG